MTAAAEVKATSPQQSSWELLVHTYIIPFAFHLPDQPVVALDPTCQDCGSSALLFSEDLMRRLPDEEDSSLVWTVLGEKNISGNPAELAGGGVAPCFVLVDGQA